MIVMQKLKFMQAFTFWFQCRNSKEKLPMHNCQRAKHEKHVNVAYKGVYMFSRAEKVHMIHIFNSNIFIHNICLIYQNLRNDIKNQVFFC